MNFLQNIADSIKDDITSGETDRIERAADTLVYALLEGPGTTAQNLDDVTRAATNKN